MFLYRPALAQPQLCSWRDCETITLKQLLDMHEALDLRAAISEKATQK